MTEIVEVKTRSVLFDMANRFNMEPRNFEATLKATVVPANVSNEQFAAFLLVAKEYNLNPLTKEIYAFPAKTGGIQPIVSIDGWLRIINEHPKFNGMTFEDNIEAGKLISITCRLYRKDRDRPIEVTEYLAECQGPTEPWKKWPIRMLRHKALIQCARYAFGFSGIIDPDEADRMKDITPKENNSLKEAIINSVTIEAQTPKNKMDEVLAREIEAIYTNPAELKAQEIIALILNSKNKKELDLILKENNDHLLVMTDDLKNLIKVTEEEKVVTFR